MCSIHDGSVEVTGSADIDHLSYFATFRRARAGLLAAHQSERSNSTSAHGPEPPSLANADPRAVTRDDSWQTGDSAADGPVLPLVRPVYVEPVSASVAAGLQDGNVEEQESIGGAPASIEVTDMMGRPSMDNYIRAADQVSDYLMLGMEQWPTWGAHTPGHPDAFLQ